jgi:hypothetical protein
MRMADTDRDIAAVIYGGVRYPISHDVAEYIISKIESFEMNSWSDFIEFPTTDGRQVLLRVSQSFPIAFESEADSE